MSLSVYTLQDISASQERLCHLLSKNYKSACAICWENIILHSHPEIEISFKFIPKISIYTLKDISASQERLCHPLSKNYNSACAIYWENIILHSHPEIEISFKFIPKISMSKECIHFFGPLCMYISNQFI